MMPIINKLKTEYQVDILCCNISNRLPKKEYSKGMNIFRYSNYKNKVIKIIVWLNTSPIELTKYSIYKRIAIKSAQWFTRLPYMFLHNSEESKLKKVVRHGDYSVLITVTSPIQPQYVAYKLAEKGLFSKRGVKWIPYFMDPFATYIGNQPNREHLIAFEEKIYKHSTFVFASSEIYEDNKNTALGKYIYKTVSIPLANLRKLEHNGRFSGFDSKKINCLYTGSLQDVKVRNPEYLFKLIKSCSDDIQFHMIISTWSQEAYRLRERFLKDAKNVIWYEKLPLTESLVATGSADILVNIGNKCTNQLPGKVCDFISSGKPIVNIYSIEADTSKRFLEDYPYKLNLYENEEIFLDQLLKLEEFCREYYNKQVEYETIEKLYDQFTSDNITSAFLKEVKSVNL